MELLAILDGFIMIYILYCSLIREFPIIFRGSGDKKRNVVFWLASDDNVRIARVIISNP